MDEQSGLCAYCFNKMTLRIDRLDTCTIDHVKARSEGGGSGRDNIVGACSQCNNEKGNKPLVIFLLNRMLRKSHNYQPVI